MPCMHSYQGALPLRQYFGDLSFAGLEAVFRKLLIQPLLPYIGLNPYKRLISLNNATKGRGKTPAETPTATSMLVPGEKTAECAPSACHLSTLDYRRSTSDLATVALDTTELIMPIPQELLDILVCPACKAPVKPTPDNSGLKCQACRRVYPVRDEIPVMLIEEATIAPE
jgi:uncharacterized protein YbaR (Trm112 family)